MKNKIITINDIKKNSKIVLWGAGVYVEEVIDILGEEKIVTIIDSASKKWGKRIRKFTIQSPETAMENLDIDQVVFLISVASYNYEIALELCNKWHVDSTHIFCFTHRFAEQYMFDVNAIQNNSKEIQNTLEFLEDEESKIYLQNLIDAKLTRNPLLLKGNGNIVEQYYYKNGKDKICVREGNTIIDCGAFTGDTANLFYEKTKGDCKIYCFEPLEGNFKRLKEWIAKNGYGDKIMCIQALVDEKEGKAMITSSQESSVQASMSQEGIFRNEVMIKTLDNSIKERVDFIKMDIEGSELKAFLGAKNLIAKYGPQMVISAYHRTSHLWEIPKLIKDIQPNYKIYLGHQPNAAFEPEYYVTL